MKSKALAKIIATVLCLAIVFTPVLNAYAENESYEVDCPYIYVHGFMGTDINSDVNDPDSECAWPPSTDAILDVVKKALPSIARVLVDRDYDKFSDEVMPLAAGLFSDIIVGKDGEICNNSGLIWSYPEKDTITASSTLNFKYDWRLDPIQSAAKLNDFIDYVLDASGCDKVILEAHSLGGVILNTYSRLYGNDKVKSYVFNTTAVYGETYTGELLTGQITLDADALMYYLDGVLDYNEKEELLDGLFKLLNDAGILDLACKLGNKILDKLFLRAATDVLVPMFARWLTIWAMVPDEMVDDAKKYIFDELYKDTKDEYSELIRKIDNYSDTVRQYKTETLRKINDETNMYVIARYGYTSIFATPSWRNMSDTVVDSKFSSFGATFAPYGSKLSDEYLSGKDEKYISPDKTADASTCLFPDQTWFVRGLLHAEEGVDNLNEMYRMLAYYDGQATVDTFDEFPQFLLYDEDNDCVVIDGYVEPKLNFIQKIIEFFKKIFDYIKGILVK